MAPYDPTHDEAKELQALVKSHDQARLRLLGAGQTEAVRISAREYARTRKAIADHIRQRTHVADRRSGS